jgi:ABC-type transport system involved in multi-copper enzyme maturation permease subunit
MKAIASHLRTAVLGSLILVLPFAILEAVNTTPTRQNAPGLIVLFGFLWFLAAVFFVVLIPTVRNVRTRNVANPLGLLIGVAVLLVVALVWGSVVADQMPCFLGVPNCD